MAEKLKIAKGNIGNALHSTAKDHVSVVAFDTYDEELQEYQSVLNSLSAIKDDDGNLQPTPFKYIVNEEYIFAMVDADDHLLAGIHWDGTPQFAKVEENAARELKAINMQIEALSEKVSVIVGDNDLTDIIDTFDEMKKFFADINNTKNLTSILAEIDSIKTDLKRNVLSVSFDRSTGQIIGTTSDRSRITGCVQDRNTGRIIMNHELD